MVYIMAVYSVRKGHLNEADFRFSAYFLTDEMVYQATKRCTQFHLH